jgi:patatin-related protein
MREKELRLALVCYGGVSLAIYMHGITKEIWKLLRASATRSGSVPDVAITADGTEHVYRELLDAVGEVIDLRVMVDIVAGASAGGINGIQLAHAMAGGYDMEQLRDLWMVNADIEKLIAAEAASTRWSKLWAMPAIWWLADRQTATIDSDVDPSVKLEVRAKLSRFLRSRWFEPPFSGPTFTRFLYEAMIAMEKGERGPVLIPPSLSLDMFVTVTDFHGSPEHLRLHSPPEIIETEHRLVIGFHSEATDDRSASRNLGHRAELVWAARATASFPGAFPPAQVGEIDAVLAARGEDWPGRDDFLARVMPRRAAVGLPPEGATLIDGSVLNNRPFGPAIEALRHRPAHREVERRFVYIDPKPGRRSDPVGVAGKPPGFFTTILRSLADIPREQPIRDNLEAIELLSSRVRRLRYVVDGMQAQVDAAIARAIGRRFFIRKLTPARLSDWRSRAQTLAAQEAGFAYAAYGQLKFAGVVESLIARLVSLGGFDMRGGAETLRREVWDLIAAQRIGNVAQATARGGEHSPFVEFLRRYDLEFRIRRLRFLIRRVNSLAETITDSATRERFELLKSALYKLLAPYLARRSDGHYSGTMHSVAAASPLDPAMAMDGLATAMDLQTLDTTTDIKLVELFDLVENQNVRKSLLRAYLGFAFYDITVLPLLQGDGIDEFDEIKVDRISPTDATTLHGRSTGDGGTKGSVLKGTQLNSFGAFFCRAYRENDYLWGRLHGAERMIDIVASTLPDDKALAPARILLLKLKAFRAILDAERTALHHVPDLIATLDSEVAALRIVAGA